LRQANAINEHTRFLIHLEGAEVPGSLHWMLRPFISKPVEELSQFSREAVPRCFRRAFVLHPLRTASWNRSLAPMADAVAKYYTEGVPPNSAPSVYTILFLARPEAIRGRHFLNFSELLEQCRSWENPPLPPGYTEVRCETLNVESDPPPGRMREFMGARLSRLRDANVLISLTGSSLYLGYFLNASMATVEIRPFNFYGEWPDMIGIDYRRDRGHFYIYQPGRIVDSEPSSAWSMQQQLLRRFPGNKGWITSAMSLQDRRDRNTRVHWAPLRSIFEQIMTVNGDRAAYDELVAQNRTLLTYDGKERWCHWAAPC
jgi:hypothetical protein